MNNENLNTRIEALKELLEYGELVKYKPDKLPEYIKESLDNANFIEAYSLAIQYVEDIIQLAIDTGRVSKLLGEKIFHFWSAMVVLRSLNFISEYFFKIYIDCKNTRDKLTHSIAKSGELSRKLLKKYNDEKYKKLPLEVIEEGNKFFLGLLSYRYKNTLEFKKFPWAPIEIIKKQFEKAHEIIAKPIISKNPRPREMSPKDYAKMIAEKFEEESKKYFPGNKV